MITSKQVSDFKESFCDENKIIPNILKQEFEPLIECPILDVGSGLGDISNLAFGDMNVIHLDIENYSNYKIPSKHTRVVKDFFEYNPQKNIKTILLSHVLQFIDGNIEKLNQKIKEITPQNIIVVRNTNDNFMGKLMRWFDEQNIQSNPERIIPDFPFGYEETKKVPFVAELKCPSYEILSEQVSYLWDVKLEKEQNDLLLGFLKQNLYKPEFEIHQEIILYKKYTTIKQPHEKK